MTKKTTKQRFPHLITDADGNVVREFRVTLDAVRRMLATAPDERTGDWQERILREDGAEEVTR